MIKPAAKTSKASTQKPPAPKPSRAVPASNGNAPEPDLKAALERAMQLMAIVGASGQEGAVAEYVTSQLRKAGVPASAITTDNANKKSPLKGQTGNLICKLPGSLPGKRRLLMAHLDTVPLCQGCRPVLKGDYVASADPTTGLGADDRAGVAVVLGAALEIVRRNLPHPPLTFFWPVQEEVGLHGSQFAQLSQLGKPQLAFNWDGGPAEKLTVGATGAYRLRIEIKGLAAHAGLAPEQGVSAIAVAGLAIAQLHKEGWHGDVRKGRRRGTSNIGYIHGGEATNVVTDRVELRAEARSHDPELRLQIAEAIENAFQKAARDVKSSLGGHGEVQVTSRLDYESFRLKDDEPCLMAAEAAVRSLGLEPLKAVTNGGLDANWMTARGIPTVTMGCGQQNVHTISERLDVAAFHHACRIALRLATAAD